MTGNPLILQLRDRTLDCRPPRAHVMGILNVTPDSFSDGGDFLAPDAAIDRALRMIGEGAAIVDIGGASSRPRGRTYGAGATRVSPQDELERILPVVTRLRESAPEALISVDTFHAEVAQAVLEAGAHLINDITGLRHDPALAGVVAAFGAGLALMHSVGEPGAMPQAVPYDDVVGTVTDSLRDALDRAGSAGVRSVLLDPGFGFGKVPQDNLRLIGHVDRLAELGHPVLVGVSRKSSIGVALGSDESPAPLEGRLFGSLGATAVAVLRGASVVRTHDVRETAELLRVVSRTLEASRA